MNDSAVYSLFDDDENEKENDENIIELIDENSITHKYKYMYNIGIQNRSYVIGKGLENKEEVYAVFEIFSGKLQPVRNENIIFMVESYLTLINKMNSGIPIIITSEEEVRYQYNIFDEINLKSEAFYENKKYHLAVKIMELDVLSNLHDIKELDDNVYEKFENNEFILKKAEIKKENIINGIISGVDKVSSILESSIESHFKPLFFGKELPIPMDSELEIIILEQNPDKSYVLVTDENIINKIKEKYENNLNISDNNIFNLIEIMAGRQKEEIIVVRDKNNNTIYARLISKIFIDKKDYYFIETSDDSDKVIACYMNSNKELELVNSPEEIKKIESFIQKIS
jgi:hypothetical protein